MKLWHYFTKTEKLLWSSSILFIVLAFTLFDRSNYLSLCASIIGITALIFCSKGNPFGQFLMIFFCIMYGIISFSYAYYGEMMTYLGMSMPMAIFSLISWFKNPFKGKRCEATVHTVTKKEIFIIAFISCVVTVVSYFLLKRFGTSNLIISTFSVATSFMAASFTFCRSPYFALVYAINDIVLIVMWILATIDNKSYVSVLVCFIVFLANDLYSFISWKKREKIQKEESLN